MKKKGGGIKDNGSPGFGCENLNLALDGRPSGLGPYDCPFGKGPVELLIVDGITCRRRTAETARPAKSVSNGWAAKLKTADGIAGDVSVKPRRRFIEYVIDIKNKARSRRFLEIRLAIRFNPRTVKYWDGWSDPVAVKPGVRHLAANADPADDPAPLHDTKFPEAYFKVLGKGAEEIHKLMSEEFGGPAAPYVFPASGVFRRSNGIILGLHPDSFHSYFSSGVEPAGKKSSRFYYSVKMVVEPQGAERVRFVQMAFDAAEQYRGILSAYYSAFGRTFSPAPDAPEELFGNGGISNYLSAYRLGGLVLELFRRKYGDAGWSWLYAPHQKTGIIDPEKDTWDKEPEAWSTWDAPELHGITLAGFRRLLKKAVSTLEPQYLQLSYVILQRCRWSLAVQKYPDAILRRSDGTPRYSPMMCVLRGEGPILTAFAYGNSFARDVRAGIRRFLTRYRNAGISFDNAVATGMHFADGPFPGAAFTHGKIYSAEALPYMTMMKFVRSIRIGGRRRLVAANTPGHYAVAALTDVGLLETRDPRWRRNMRHLLGAKPFIWSGHAATDKEKAELQALEAILEGIYLYDGPYDKPDGKWKKYRSEVLELSRIGWNPLRGGRVKPPIRLERFGSGLGSRFVVGNPLSRDRIAQLSVNAQKGDKEVVLFALEGKRLKWKRKGNRFTTSVKIPARGYRILKGLVCIQIDPSNVRSYDVSLRKSRLSAVVRIEKEVSGCIRLSLPSGKISKGFFVNRRKIENVSAERIALSRSTYISLLLEDEVRVFPDKKSVANFPFLKGERSNSNIIPLAGKNADRLAGRLQDYFAFYDAWNRCLAGQEGQFPKLPEKILRIPIAKSKSSGANLAAVGVIESNSSWGRRLSAGGRRALRQGRPVIEAIRDKNSRLLIVGGADEAAAKKALFSLLSILDEKYVLKKGRRI